MIPINLSNMKGSILKTLLNMKSYFKNLKNAKNQTPGSLTCF